MANTYKFYDYLNTDIITDLGIDRDVTYDVDLGTIHGIRFGSVDGSNGIAFYIPGGSHYFSQIVYSFDEGRWVYPAYQTFTAEGISSSYIKKSDGTPADDCIIEWLQHVTYVVSQIDPPSTTTYTVTFNVQGHGTAPSTQTITSGGTVSQPTSPTASGYRFSGWYNEAQCINSYNFSARVYSDLTLYAKWVELGVFVYRNNGWYKISANAYKRVNGSWKLLT